MTQSSTNKSVFSGFVLGCFIIVVLLTICFMFMIVLGSLASSGSTLGTEGYVESEYRDGNSSETIAVLYLDGVIMDADDGVHETTIVNYILKGLDAANENDDVQAVIMVVNSPGGGVYDSALITDKMSELQANDKPVVAVIEDLAASGGYWVSAQSDYIFIHPQSLTGSIGVFFQFTEFDELFNKIGIDQVYITNTEGKNKVPQNLGNPETEGHQIFKNLADESYESFVNIIVNGRNLSRAEVIPYADGRILSAQEAKDAKLVDEFGGLDDAIDHVAIELSLDEPNVVKYYRSEMWGFSSLNSKVNILFNDANPLAKSGFGMYALPEFMMGNGSDQE